MKQPLGLLSVLRDSAAREDERDDAAIDLSAFDEVEVEQALIAVASDSQESESVAESAGASLGEIWARNGRIPVGVMVRLQPVAKYEAEGFLRTAAPALLEGYLDADNSR